MEKPKISVTVITLNEEGSIAKCLTSVKNFADEIIVVDSGSKDKTVEISRQMGAKVYSRVFDNYANQKNYALQKTTGDWVFSIDADEEATQELVSEIKSKLSTHGDLCVAYSIPRKNIIFGKFIKYSRWQPELDRHVWLWKKQKGNWVGDVHEEVYVNGEVGKLSNAKIHYQYKSVSQFAEMMNRYSEREAKYLTKKGVKFSYLKLIFQPIYNFLVRYFYRLGFLDGWRGFVLSYLMAVYHLELWIKVWARK
jgi:glycosyltransferase involved in cell wall biosynthesis